MSCRDLSKNKKVNLEHIIKKYQGMIRGICSKWMYDKSYVDDAVQESIIKIWRGLDSYDSEKELGAWITGVTRNMCIDILRRSRRGEIKELEDSDISTLEGTKAEGTVAQAPYPPVTMDQLKHLALKIPEAYGQRKIFWYHLVLGRTILDTAKKIPSLSKLSDLRQKRVVRENKKLVTDLLYKTIGKCP